MQEIRGRLLLVALLLLAGVAGAREQREMRQVQRMAPEELLRSLIAGDAPLVVDARPPRVYAQGHIPGALNIPSKDVFGWVPDLEPHRDRGILFYCNDGLVSGRAARKLLREGFRKVFVMQGNLRRWRELGYPLEVSAPE